MTFTILTSSYLKVLKFYVLILGNYDHILKKRGIVFKGGHYIREDII